MSTDQDNADRPRALAGTIAGALLLARERVTGDSLEAKRQRRDELERAAQGVHLQVEEGSGGPTASMVRELLGNPDDAGLRLAISEWAILAGE